VGGQRYALAALLPGLTHRLGWPQAGLESTEILAPTAILSPDCSVRSESLQGIRASGPLSNCRIVHNRHVYMLVMLENKQSEGFVDM